MAARTHSVDPRAERVRTRLRDAAFALAHERPVDEMTVGDIVARAEVSRQVFYQHFRDRDDAVATAFTVAFAAATADIGGDARARITALFAFAAEHRVHVPQRRAERGHPTRRRGVPRRTPARLRTRSPRRACRSSAPIAGLTPESVSRFLVGGFMEVLRSWMEDPDATDLRGRVDRRARHRRRAARPATATTD